MDMDDKPKRVPFLVRIPPELAHDIRHLAWQRGLSGNAMATALLRYGISATNERVSLNDRLNMMGVR